MIKLDMMDVQFPDNSFDVIYVSHILEHGADDRRALRELIACSNPVAGL